MRVGGAGALLLTSSIVLACGRTDRGSEVSSDGSMVNGGSVADVCLLIACLDGYVSQPGSDGGCPICVRACADVVCTEADCEDGWHAETRPHDCCPVCVKDEAPICGEAQLLYQAFRAEWLASYEGQSCLQEQDCGLLSEHNRCATTCGTPLGVDAINRIEPELSAFAEVTCSRCPSPVASPCPMPPALMCFDGNCREQEPLPQ